MTKKLTPKELATALARNGWASLTAEQRAERVAKAAAGRWNGKDPHAHTAKMRAVRAEKAAKSPDSGN